MAEFCVTDSRLTIPISIKKTGTDLKPVDLDNLLRITNAAFPINGLNLIN